MPLVLVPTAPLVFLRSEHTGSCVGRRTRLSHAAIYVLMQGGPHAATQQMLHRVSDMGRANNVRTAARCTLDLVQIVQLPRSCLCASQCVMPQ